MPLLPGWFWIGYTAGRGKFQTVKPTLYPRFNSRLTLGKCQARPLFGPENARTKKPHAANIPVSPAAFFLQQQPLRRFHSLTERCLIDLPPEGQLAQTAAQL